ncbi:MAG: hypothetical protein RIS47_2350 [Bacteroidota bacterium]|jgi:seryl-tRNA synthetase
MLTLKQIKEQTQEVIQKLAVKYYNAESAINKVLQLDERRRAAQTSLDQNLAESKLLAKEIGMLLKQGKTEEADIAKQKTAELKELARELMREHHMAESEMNDLLTQIPNIPHESVPLGRHAEDNVEIRTGGVIPQLPAGSLPHWDLAKKYDIIDFEMGVKLTGAGFPVYKSKGARLQRALINFFLDQAREAGYAEVMPPIMVNEDSGFGTGQLPDKEGQMYNVLSDGLYLIPTAEVPVTNMYRDVILDETDFPIKNTAYTPCFRREAGSYGKDVKGLNRLHQFDKVEIVQISHPDVSYQALDGMVAYVESLIQKLGLPYRIIRLCGGDMSFTSALTYDFEVWSAGQERWLEVSSVSNFEAYQANRLKLRFKSKDGKATQLAHTLNGSALALPRIVAAMLENYQTEKGIRLPDVLIPYAGFEYID